MNWLYITTAITLATSATHAASTIKPSEALLFVAPSSHPAYPIAASASVELDPVLGMLARNELGRPTSGDSAHGTSTWVSVSPDAYGRIPAPSGAWIAYRVDDAVAGPAMLTCGGHNLAIVNGASRVGATESPGIHKLPITLREGNNDILVRSSGGPITMTIDPLDGNDLVFVSPYDATLPQIIDLQPVDEVGSILIINASDRPLEGLDIATYCRFVPDQKMIPRLYPELPPTQWHVEPMVSIPANSVRKVPFRIVGPPPFKLTGSPYPVDVEIRNAAGTRMAGNVVNLATRYPTDRIRHTWISELDGSVQSCIMVPPASEDVTEGPKPLLMALTASVKSPHSTARAYHHQDDRYVCVPWSRRTGVAGTPLGRADAMEALAQMHSRYEIDESRQCVTGFSDAGRAAWRLALSHPESFAGVMPVGTDLPGDVPLSTARDMHVLLRWGADDPSMPADAAKRLNNALASNVASATIEVIPEQGHWWGRDTVASESLDTFLASSTRTANPVATPTERDGFDRILERPLILVYGTQGTDNETHSLRNKARFDQERMWITSNAGATVISDTEFDTDKSSCSNVILYGNADTNLHWHALTAGIPITATRTHAGTNETTHEQHDLILVSSHRSPLCSEATVGVVAPTGDIAHRMLVSVPITEPVAKARRTSLITADTLSGEDSPLATAK